MIRSEISRQSLQQLRGQACTDIHFPEAGEASVVMDLNYTYHGTDIRDAVLEVEQTEDGRTERTFLGA